MKRVLIFWVAVLFILSYWAVFRSDGIKSKNLSEEDYIDQTLNKLGWPAQAGSSSVFKPVSGQTYLPVRNFYKNQSLNLFGTYNTGKFTGFHTGVDIEVSPADLYAEVPVYSFYDGTVRKVEWASGYGGVVTIE